MMTQKTLDFIHQSYQEALANSANIIQIIQNLFDILVDAEVCDEDARAYDAFVDGLRNCLKIRKMTSDITDIVTYITITIMHIIKWLNISKHLDIDIILHGRRKSLESDLTKLLRKSNQTLSAKIRDRFGLRGILLNETEEDAIQYIYLIEDAITGILAAKNRKMRKEFMEWITTSNYVSSINKITINEVLKIPFDVGIRKDFITTPKKNGYQSLHFILTIEPYSHLLGGTHLEIQLRTKKMDDNAEHGTACYDEYKKYLNDDLDLDSSEDSLQEDNPLLRVFVVDDFSKVHIPGFSSYKHKQDDEDGIHFSKEFADRRISETLVPDTFIVQALSAPQKQFLGGSFLTIGNPCVIINYVTFVAKKLIEEVFNDS